MADQQNAQFTKGDQYDGFVQSFEAEGAISKNQIVELGTAWPQVVKHTTTTTTITIGIALSDAADGEMVPIMCFGPIKLVICDANGITRGEAVYPGATAGSCRSKAYADGTTLYGVIGIALETGDEAGELVPVLCGWPGLVAMT